MARIVVSGYMIRHPMVGLQLAYFHYLLGLSRLGHEIIYLEESGWPDSCYNTADNTYSNDPTFGIGRVRDLFASFNVNFPLLYVNQEDGNTVGADLPTIERHLRDCDAWINLGGVCMLPQFELCRRKVLVDMDPLFTQLGEFAGGHLDFYDVHFTYGTNIGKANCPIPRVGIDWKPLLPPVVPDLWETSSNRPPTGSPARPLTTLASWSAYGDIEWDGRSYGQKDREFLRIVDLPRHCEQDFTLALTGEGPAIREKFRAGGWTIVDAAKASDNLTNYMEFIQASAGEFSCAKHAYVATRSGWFSDRSVCYLAAGLPIVVQDTGVGDTVETGSGILTFHDTASAAAAIDDLRTNYLQHCRRARELAHDVFSNEALFPAMLETIMTTEKQQATDAANAAAKG